MVGVSQVTFRTVNDSGEKQNKRQTDELPEKQLSDRGGGTVMKEKGMSLRARPDLGRGSRRAIFFLLCKGSWELEPGDTGSKA